VNGAWTKAPNHRRDDPHQGQPDEHLKVTVTRHGPIVHREEKKLRAALDATERRAREQLQLAGKGTQLERIPRNNEARVGPGQNAVYADVEGNIDT